MSPDMFTVSTCLLAYRNYFQLKMDPPRDQWRPVKMTTTISSTADLWRVCLKSKWATVEIPELEFEISADGKRHTDSIYNHIASAVYNLGNYVSGVIFFHWCVWGGGGLGCVGQGGGGEEGDTSLWWATIENPELKFFADLKRHTDSIYNHMGGEGGEGGGNVVPWLQVRQGNTGLSDDHKNSPISSVLGTPKCCLPQVKCSVEYC